VSSIRYAWAHALTILYAKVQLKPDSFIPPDLDPSLVQPPLPATTAIPTAVKASKPSPEGDDISCLVEGVADTMRLGQSYRSIGFDKERAIVNKALAERGEQASISVHAIADRQTVMRKDIKHEKVLTAVARRTIANLLLHNLHSGQSTACEPPYMPPSEDPNDYSAVSDLLNSIPGPSDPSPLHQWCSLCGDFGALLLLCASCRVGICVRTRGTTGGCLIWHEKMTRQNLIFNCLFCSRRLRFKFEVSSAMMANVWA